MPPHLAERRVRVYAVRDRRGRIVKYKAKWPK